MTDWREPVVLTAGEYLAQATVLLQRMRLARPVGGIWEAADVQWWSRRVFASDAAGQLVWLDDGGDPLAAVLLTGFTGGVQCDVLVLPDDPAFAAMVWESGLRRVSALAPAAEVPVRADDVVGVAALEAAGYLLSDELAVVASWLAADARPEIRPLPSGYRLSSRADEPDEPHPMTARNGPDVEARLRTCSLYEPELDLVVRAPDGSAAGYGLFWADSVTKVGLVEPMRTEGAHERRGIASHILATGLDLLGARGCRRLKVSNDIDLYLRAGFVPLPASSAPVYVAGPAGAGY